MNAMEDTVIKASKCILNFLSITVSLDLRLYMHCLFQYILLHDYCFSIWKSTVSVHLPTQHPKPINSVNFSLYLANLLWLQLQIETVISWGFLLSNRRPVFGLLAIMKHGFVQFFERKYTKRPVLSLASLSSARKGAELIIVLINNFDKHGSWSQRGPCFGIY